jgi:two-component system response regulator MprA
MTHANDLLLIVDDDLDIRETLSDVLTEEGYEVLTAVEASDALRVLRESARKPALILLDLVMPGMTAAEFRAEQLSDPALAAIPVAVFSAAADPREAVSALGAKGYVKKPLNIEELLAAMERLTSTD